MVQPQHVGGLGSFNGEEEVLERPEIDLSVNVREFNQAFNSAAAAQVAQASNVHAFIQDQR